jgi:hypothetical protein
MNCLLKTDEVEYINEQQVWRTVKIGGATLFQTAGACDMQLVSKKDTKKLREG